MKDVNKILLLLILFPVDLSEFLTFMDEKAKNILARKEYLKKVLIPVKYVQLMEGAYFRQSNIYSYIRNTIPIDRFKLSEIFINDRNLPFILYCLKRFAHSKHHPISRLFMNELVIYFKTECDAETDSLRSQI